MFYGNGYMGGMHGGWWLLLVLVVGVALFYAWQRPVSGGNAPEGTPPESPHEVLRRRLASGALTPQQYEEHKALLDRDN